MLSENLALVPFEFIAQKSEYDMEEALFWKRVYLRENSLEGNLLFGLKL